MVVYIKSDLEFILKQIKIAEDHALFEQSNGTQGKPLFGPTGSIPTYNLAWGLRTVDGTYNNPLYPERGAADNPFLEHLGTDYRPAEGTPLDMDGPGGQPPVPTAPNYDPSNDPQNIVVDGSVRTISNLIVDQTLGNPSAILTALQRAGIVAPADQMTVTGTISAAYEPLKPLFNAVNTAAREHAEASAAASASPGNVALQQAAADALAALEAARAALDASDDALMTLLTNSGIELSGANVVITNTAPDEGLSAPFNSWFTLFGQFFDHGLDLVAKGGSGTVFIPLRADDPLYDPASPTNFMVLTRASVSAGTDGIMNTADDVRPVNNTTAFVDQNQTYTSHPSHQVFLRQYELVGGRPVATGNLIEGADGGMATWADVKAQARDILGIELLDVHVGNLPLLATDAYGNFIPDPVTGFPQVVMAGPPQFLASGTNESPLSLVNTVADGPDADTLPDLVHLAVRTGHAFLADIAHNAVPTGLADGDIEIGLGNPDQSPTDGQYDNELLDAHFIAGDGRANENIGLTAVHHVFHAEHNRLVQHTKEVVFADAEAMLQDGASQAEAVAFLNEWLAVDVAAVPLTAAGLSWDGERLFQAAKFGTEMQYQHLVFEEFARKIQPNINVFLVPDGYDVTLDPSIVAEFAHVVYRFGHSMLTETIDRFDPTFTDNHIGLIEGFLNPLQFRNNGTGVAVEDGIAAGAIVRGMTRQVGNEIDEFVTSALRNNLLGLPLDLATINLARGRDTGVPSLNDARAQFYAATNEDALLKPYESWVDFAGHLKHEASIINFIAAYGTHALITGQATIEGKRDAAMTLIFNQSFGGLEVQADAVDFLNATGIYAGGALGGLNNVDLWIGGLAEAIMPFGGMLGSTFNFVFETQMENLQNGDRFYYLQRLDGLHLFGEMENNSFAAMIMRNTDATHLPSDVFSTPGLILEVDRVNRQFNDLDGNGTLENDDPLGSGILTPLVVRNDPSTPGTDTNYLRYTGGDHVVLGGTDNADTLIAGIGDDTLFGDGGNDRLEGGFGNDIINGGDGDDIIKDSGGDDNIKAGAGNDVVHAGPGLDLVMGNDGQDFIFLGTDMGSEVFAGTGNDFIYGNKNAERILGNEGNDWIETGTFDGAPGDNFDEIFSHDEINGHDVFLGDGGFDEFIGEGGNEIFVGSAGRGKMVGMSGFDWATYKDNPNFVNADLSIPIVFDEAPTLPQNAALDEYESVEGLSGTRFNDVLTGTNLLAADRLPTLQGGTEGYQGSALDAEGIALIAGLQEVLGAGVTEYSAGDIILGGDGSDVITGQAGDDIIDGDKWLDVQIGVFAPDDVNHTGTPSELHNSMTTLAARMFSGEINPGRLSIVRTIRNDQPTDSDGLPDVDVAVFSDVRANYTITGNDDGTISVAHVTVTDGLESDGVDRVRNVEILRFSDVDVSLIKPVVDLHAFNVGGTYSDTFSVNAYNNSNGATTWGTVWSETGDDGSATAAAGQIQVTGGNLRFDTGDGATITRTVPLAGAAGATLTYQVNEQSLENNDSVSVEFSSNGTTWVNVDTINDATGNTTRNVTLPGPFTATSAIRFVATSLEAAVGGNVNADLVDISSVTIEFTVLAPDDGLNYTTSYTEGAAGVSITNRPNITDDGATLVSAKIVLTNAQPGDDFDIVGALPAGISSSTDTTVDGVITLNLTGSASLAAYRAAIAQVTFDSTSDNPSVVPRIIQVSVNDGFVESDPATTTINITQVNDTPNAVNDTVISNVANNVAFAIPEWMLLANDTDADGNVLDVTAVGSVNNLASAVLGAGTITVTDNNTTDGSFVYTANDGSGAGNATDTATVTIDRSTATTFTGNNDANLYVLGTTADTVNSSGGNDIVFAGGGIDTVNAGSGNDRVDGGDAGDTITAGAGDDIVDGGTGNDTIVWNANANGDTDGYDYVDGNFGTDTFDVNTRASQAEIFRVYTRAFWEDTLLQGGLQPNTEIVITRTVSGVTSIIAELDNVEEIRIGTQATDPVTGPAGGTPGDTVQIFGDFSTTSLALNTITIDGNVGDDTIDISSLDSAHRIVFRSNGGNDTIVGALRPQDVIQLLDGETVDDYVKTVTNGVTTLTNGNHSISYVASGEGPQIGGDVDDEMMPPYVGTAQTGTPLADVLMGTEGDDNIIAFAGDDVAMGNGGADAISAGEGGDFISGGAGRDVIFAGAGDDQVLAGADNDIVYGDAGADRIFGDQGNDLITAGAGDDTVFGGAGDDLIVAEVGDGNDVYFGDEGGGGTGIDTLDMSAATANVTVNLGSGALSNGTASSSQTGNDTIWGIENVNTGSGNDTITASNAVNVINGGAGNDTFKFTSTVSANGDIIVSFEPGDRIDLTAIDANTGAAGDQSFTLVNGAPTAAGQLGVTFETREDGDFTVVQGNIDGNPDAEFKIEIAGHQNLNGTNLGL
jgi:Ca2+-binding RTX toxin-like protein